MVDVNFPNPTVYKFIASTMARIHATTYEELPIAVKELLSNTVVSLKVNGKNKEIIKF